MTRLTITQDELDAAALAAARAVWRKAHGGDFDTDHRVYPDKAGFLREELEALLPALDALHIGYPTQSPAHPEARE